MPTFPILRRLGAISFLAATMLIAGCGDDAATEPVQQTARLELQVPAQELYEGDMIAMAAVLRDANGVIVPGAPITWIVSDSTRGEVAADGHLSVYRAGALTVSAKSGAHTASRTLTIRRSAVQTITVFPGLSELRLTLGDARPIGVRVQGEGGRDLTGRLVQLSTDDASVASIDATGRVHGIKPGVTMLRATAEGVTGSLRVEVLAEPTVLTLSHLGATRLPVLVASDSVMWDGVREYHEIYLESGTLTLHGGTQPRYEIDARCVEYVVRTIGGRREMQIRTHQREYDRGIVQADARGDLQMTSEYISPLAHTASAETGGFRVRFRVPGDDTVLDLFYRREP